jgi:hypothetical protein
MIAEKVAPPPAGVHAVVGAALGTVETPRVDATEEAQKEAEEKEKKALKAWERE